MKIAAQAFTIRRELEADADAALAQLRAVGFDALELAGLAGRRADELARSLQRAGIEAIAMHVSLERLRREPDSVGEEAVALGIRDLVIASLGEGQRDFGVADYRRSAAELDRLGATLGERGFRLHFHNHASELALLDGVRPLALVAEGTGAHIRFELDLAWVRVAGEDPLVWLRRLAGRLTFVHLKDVVFAAESHTFRPLGAGVIDWRPVLAACRDAGVVWGIVEDDDTLEGPYDSLRRSLAHLAELAAVGASQNRR